MNCEKIHHLVVKLQNTLVNERCDENSTNVHAHTRAEKGNIRVSRTRGGGVAERADGGSPARKKERLCIEWLKRPIQRGSLHAG